MKCSSIVIETQVCLLFPVFILLLPDKWVLSWVAAAAIHECFHLLVIWLFNVKVLKFEIGLFGAKIETEPMDHHKELIVALAGPVGALTALLFSQYIPQIVLCVIAQSAYNLLPVYPLDGGRAVRCLLVSRIKKQYLDFAEKGIAYTLFLISVLISIFLKLGLLPVILGLSLLLKHRNANMPCK